jgi:hypothetical protein
MTLDQKFNALVAALEAETPSTPDEGDLAIVRRIFDAGVAAGYEFALGIATRQFEACLEPEIIGLVRELEREAPVPIVNSTIKAPDAPKGEV